MIDPVIQMIFSSFLALVGLSVSLVLYRTAVELYRALKQMKEITKFLFPDGITPETSKSFVEVHPEWNEELEGRT